MRNEVLSHSAMCLREGMSLQQGMNFCPARGYSILLMSVRRGAPYRDEIVDDGLVLIYEGHDAKTSIEAPDPKTIDQPMTLPSGRPTENGKFLAAALAAKRGESSPRKVRVYEKIKPGIWAYCGLFDLVDGWREHDGTRNVFRFRLRLAAETPSEEIVLVGESPGRIIPAAIKVEVWQRDGGRCVICGAVDELHFDHILPYSRGGSSITASNVQLLCARHNLSKGAKIE